MKDLKPVGVSQGSGACSVLFTFCAPVAVLGLAPLLGLAYSMGLQYVPRLGKLFFLVWAVTVFGAGVLGYVAAYAGKCRNVMLAIVNGLVVALVVVIAAHYTTAALKRGVASSASGVDWIVDIAGQLPTLVVFRARDWTDWVFWGLEGVPMLATGAFAGWGAARSYFCDACMKWLPGEYQAATIDVDAAIVAGIRAETDPDRIRAIVIRAVTKSSPDGRHTMTLKRVVCPSCTSRCLVWVQSRVGKAAPVDAPQPTPMETPQFPKSIKFAKAALVDD